MAQILRPDQTIARSNLDSSHDEYYDINDESDSTYILTGSSWTSGYLNCGLPAPPETPGGGLVTVYFRIRCLDTQGTTKCEIFQGTTSKGYLTKYTTASWATNSFTANITDFSDLRITITFSTRYQLCSEVWVEVPDAVSGIGLEMGCNF